MEKYFKNETEKRYFFELKKAKKILKSENKKFNEENLKKYCEENIKHRKEISNLKNAIEILIDRNVIEDENYLTILEEQQKIKPKHKRKVEEPLKLRNTLNSINRLKSKKLKTAYRLQIISGLRIAELSNLEKKDIRIDEENNIYIYVKNGKGNKNRIIRCLKDDYVLKNLKNLKENKKGKLLLSRKYMMEKARKINFHTHDLRKTNIKIIYLNTTENSVEKMQQQLGHVEGTKTYLKYKDRDIIFYGTKYAKHKKMLEELKDFKNEYTMEDF
jgi:integrase